MRIFTTTAIAALLVGGMGALALAPAANADDATAPAVPAATAPAAPDAGQDVARADDAGMPGRPGMMGHWGQRGGPGGRGDLRADLLNIACGDRGAEALEIAMVRLQYAVKPTAEQAPLLDALKTAALADQKTFAASCKTAMGDAQPGKATILDRLQTRLALDNAKVAALSDVLPKFKAFYDSLTDAQKAAIEPHHGPRAAFNGMWNHQGQNGWQHHGMRQMRPMDGQDPGQPGDASAPSDDQDAPATDNQS